MRAETKQTQQRNSQSEQIHSNYKFETFIELLKRSGTLSLNPIPNLP